jgi:hypothetical protein
MVELFKRKPTPEEMTTKIAIAEAKLSKRESEIKDKRDKARASAKDALSKGDERGFRVASKEYGSAQGQLNTVGTMVEMSQTMKNALDDQQDITEIVQIGRDLAYAQKLMGFDTEKMEQAITNIKTAVDKVNTTSEILGIQMEALTNTPESSKEQDTLKSELMAEMKAETGKQDEIREKIKKERELA